MDKGTRNTLRNVVTKCRKLLEDAIAEVLEGQFGIHKSGSLESSSSMVHLSEEEQAFREQLRVHLDHIKAGGFEIRDAIDQLIREVAFTQLNRLCAYKMMEKRGLIREAVSRGLNSNGFKFYLAAHPDEERLWMSGGQYQAYLHYLKWLGGTLSEEIGVLFSPHDPANKLFPPQRILDSILALINSEELADIWDKDETIGWIYQYFTPKELREKARKESQAPRNSYELAFRNQFYTPRYVVDFLADNTLGRTWYEMRKGKTSLNEKCRYLVRYPDEVFLGELNESGSPDQAFLQGDTDEITEFVVPQCTLNTPEGQFPYYSDDEAGHRLRSFSHFVRPFDWPNDPRSEYFVNLLSKAEKGEVHEPIDGTTQDLWDCIFVVVRNDRFSEGTFASHAKALTRLANDIRCRLLQARKQDLSQEELLKVPHLIPFREKKDPRELKILDPACGSGHFLLYCFDLLETIYEEAYSDQELGPALKQSYSTLEELKRAIPGLILARNLHGVDIDLRATQIASLALWLRAQRAYSEQGFGREERPKIRRSNIVVAEPMPGEKEMLQEFISGLQPPIIGSLVETVFEKMKLAGEAGTLLKIEEEIKTEIARAKEIWLNKPETVQVTLFGDRVPSSFQTTLDFAGITDEDFWDEAEARVLEELERYAKRAVKSQKLMRQLFAEDAAHGFAFVDICRKKYDVVLMNPPFGATSLPSKPYINKVFPRTRNDVYAAFVERMLQLLFHKGFIGIISSRTGFFLSSFTTWREEILMKEASLHSVADFGFGVLEAMVETAAYTIEKLLSPKKKATFFRLLKGNVDVKGEELWKAIQNPNSERRFQVELASFSLVPNTPFSYWVCDRIRRKFKEFPQFEGNGGTVKQGLATAKDFRFIRTNWEVMPRDINAVTWTEWTTVRNASAFLQQEMFLERTATKRWANFTKGGEYSPYFSDIHLVVNWKNEGKELRAFAGSVIRNPNFYFRAGLTYPLVNIRFNPRAMSAGCIFSHKGIAIFPHENLIGSLGLFNANLIEKFIMLLRAQHGYEVGQLQKIPFKHFRTSILSELSLKILNCQK